VALCGLLHFIFLYTLECKIVNLGAAAPTQGYKTEKCMGEPVVSPKDGLMEAFNTRDLTFITKLDLVPGNEESFYKSASCGITVKPLVAKPPCSPA
jgi:hypothetical protein